MSLPYSPYEFSSSVVSCPYNENHRIARSRLQKHINKCEKNYPPGYRVMCPYDATHRLAESQLSKHIDICPMRALIEAEFYEYEQTQSTGHDVTIAVDGDEEVYNVKERYIQSAADSQTYELQHKFENATNFVNELRPPRGYSQAMMINTDDSNTPDDTDSVFSFMAVGRGIPVKETDDRLHQVIGRGRGMPSFLGYRAPH